MKAIRSRAEPARLGALLRCRRGVAGVELALILPFLLLLFTGMVEAGRLVSHATTLNKALYSAGTYAARKDKDFSDTATIKNLVLRGSPQGDAPLLFPYLANATVSQEALPNALNDPPVSVLRIRVRVPYQPLFSGFLRPLGLDEFTLDFTHEQPFLGT